MEPLIFSKINEDCILQIRAYTPNALEIGYLDVELGDEFLINEIGVAKDYRNQGVATSMLDYLFETMSNNEIIRPVSVCFPLDESTKSAKEFFMGRREFAFTEDGTEYVVAIKDIIGNESIAPLLDTAKDKADNLCKYETLTNSVILQMIDDFNNLKIPVEQTVYDCRSTYTSDLSLAFIDSKTGAVKAAALGIEDENTITLAALYSTSRDGRVLAATLGKFLEQAMLSPEKELRISAVNQCSENLCKKLFSIDKDKYKMNRMLIGTYIPRL